MNNLSKKRKKKTLLSGVFQVFLGLVFFCQPMFIKPIYPEDSFEYLSSAGYFRAPTQNYNFFLWQEQLITISRIINSS